MAVTASSLPCDTQTGVQVQIAVNTNDVQELSKLVQSLLDGLHHRGAASGKQTLPAAEDVLLESMDVRPSDACTTSPAAVRSDVIFLLQQAEPRNDALCVGRGNSLHRRSVGRVEITPSNRRQAFRQPGAGKGPGEPVRSGASDEQPLLDRHHTVFSGPSSVAGMLCLPRASFRSRTCLYRSATNGRTW